MKTENPGLLPFGVILSDFEPIQISPPIRQQTALALTKALMTGAACSAQGTENKTQAETVLQEIDAAVETYGVSADHIGFRALATFQPEGKKISELPFMDFPVFKALHENPMGETLQARMRRFEDAADQVFEIAYPKNNGNAPDDLIHVSCSGYVSPSPAQKSVLKNGFGNTSVTHSYHMGCYGAFPAMRMAHGFLASARMFGRPKKKADIVHTEYLSLHADLLAVSPENIVNMSLFGDGFIKYSAFDSAFFPEGKTGLTVIAAHENLLPDSENEMSWKLGGYHFDMRLSRNVPLHIADAIDGFMAALAEKSGLERAFLIEKAVFALHPGGPKILDFVHKKLGLKDGQLIYSRKVLYDHGNMSSATVPYIFGEIIADENILPGTYIVAIAFGPGLTATGMVLQKTKN